MKKQFLVLSFLLLFINAKAQWVQTNGPGAGKILSLTSNGTTLVAGTTYARVFVSLDSGLTWTGKKVLSWITSDIKSVGTNGSLILAGTNGDGLFKSTNNGLTWTLASASYPSLAKVTTILFKGTDIFVGTVNGYFFKSSDGGLTWVAPGSIAFTSGFQLNTLITDGRKIYGGANGVYMTANDGVTWTALTSGFPGTLYVVNSLVRYDTTIIAGTQNAGLYKSLNGGTTWSPCNGGIPSGATSGWSSVVMRGTNVYAGNSGELWGSTNSGGTWFKRQLGLNSTHINAMTMIGSKLYAGTDAAGVFFSINDGLYWDDLNVGLIAGNVSKMCYNGSTVYATTDGKGAGLYKSSDNGLNWICMSDTMENAFVYNVASVGPKIFTAGLSGVYRTLNNGATWINTYPGGVDRLSVAINGSTIYCGTTSGIFKSINDGATWTAANTGLPSASRVWSILVSGTDLFIGTDTAIYKSTNAGLSWTESTGLTLSYVYNIVKSGSNIYAGTISTGVVLSTDNGATWNQVNTGLPATNVYAIAADGPNVFASVSNGVYVSSNNGANWSPVAAINYFGTSLVVTDSFLMVGTMSGVSKISLSSIETNISVWPGDANHDYVADNFDLLPIGLYYGASGVARASVSNSWAAYPCAGWGTLQSNGSDIKHADCNGDGLIDNNDTLAVNLNYSSVHAFVASESDERLLGEDIYVVLPSGSHPAGSTVTAEIWLGSSVVPVSSIYGIAFDLNYDASLVQPGTESLTYSSSWIGTPGVDAIKFGKVSAVSNAVLGAITRIDHLNTNGYGKIADFSFQLKTGISSPTTMPISVSAHQGVDATGATLLFNTIADTLDIIPLATGVNDGGDHTNISVSPNPSSGMVTISYTLEKNASLRIDIVNGLGQVQESLVDTNEAAGYHTFGFNAREKGLETGIYYMRITVDGKPVMKRMAFIK